MSPNEDEKAAMARFKREREFAHAPVRLEIERRVCGSDYGGTSWTTVDEAVRVARCAAEKALGDVVGKDVFFYSISLDPKDTTADVREYAELFGVGPGWTFLTGDEHEITRLRHKLGAFDPDPEIDKDKTQHAGLLICGNEPKGRWMGIPALLPVSRLVKGRNRVALIE